MTMSESNTVKKGNAEIGLQNNSKLLRKRLLDENCNGPWLVPGTQTVKPRAKLIPAQPPQAAHPPVDVAPIADNQI